MARPYNFDVIPTVHPNGHVAWKLCHTKSAVNYPDCGVGTAADPYPNVKVPMGETGIFQFTISGATGIAFAPSPPNQGPPSSAHPGPIWIHEKGQPNGPVIDPQIGPPGDGGSNKLTFVDLNTEAVTLKYQLNFVDAQGKAVTALDPDIINGGKGLMSNVAFMIAAGVAIALLALWMWQVVSARRTNGKVQSGAGNDKSAG